VGVQNVHLHFPEDAAQPEPDPEIPHPAELQGKDVEALQGRPALEFPSGVAGQEQAVAPLPHGFGLG
jgi:hypothetical protein